MVRHLLILIALILPLTAAPARAQDSLRLIIPDNIRPVMGEMIPVTVRGEYDGFVALEKMSFPDSPAYDWIQTQPDDWHKERIAGREWQIFERRIALFPRRDGRLVIGPVTHHLTMADGAARREVAVTAPPVGLSITAFPAPGLPLAARDLKVTDELSGDPARIGDDQTIQRRITITAQGTMGHLLPPRPDLREKWLISFTAPEKRETRLTANGPMGFVQWEWSLRPITGEQGTLPPIRFSWFDLAKRELRGAITQPIIFGYGRVGGGLDGAPAPRWPMRVLAGAAAAAGLILALVLLMRTRGLAPVAALRRRIGRLRPNPHAAALRQAVQGGDLLALRRVARAYAGHARAMGRGVDPGALAQLDRAIFAPGAQALDRRAFLDQMTRRHRQD